MGLRFRQLALRKKAGQKRAPNNGSRCYGLPDVQSWRVDVDECGPAQLAMWISDVDFDRLSSNLITVKYVSPRLLFSQHYHPCLSNDFILRNNQFHNFRIYFSSSNDTQVVVTQLRPTYGISCATTGLPTHAATSPNTTIWYYFFISSTMLFLNNIIFSIAWYAHVHWL